MDAFAASNAAREVETVNKFPSVHRLIILHMGPDLVLLFDFGRDPSQNFFHVLRRELLVMLLEKSLKRGVIGQITQRFECCSDSRDAGERQGRRAKKVAPVHSG